jgi:hypothetical protein
VQASQGRRGTTGNRRDATRRRFRQDGQARRRGKPIPSRGTLCRVPNPMSATGTKQGWNGQVEERNAERLRKPESVAQPGGEPGAGRFL